MSVRWTDDKTLVSFGTPPVAMTSPKNSTGVSTPSARLRYRTRPENSNARKESTQPPMPQTNSIAGDGEDLREKYKLEDLDLKTTLGKCRFVCLGADLSDRSAWNLEAGTGG